MDKDGEKQIRKVFTQLDRVRRDLDHANRVIDGLEGLRWPGSPSTKKNK